MRPVQNFFHLILISVISPNEIDFGKSGLNKSFDSSNLTYESKLHLSLRNDDQDLTASKGLQDLYREAYLLIKDLINKRIRSKQENTTRIIQNSNETKTKLRKDFQLSLINTRERNVSLLHGSSGFTTAFQPVYNDSNSFNNSSANVYLKLSTVDETIVNQKHRNSNITSATINQTTENPVVNVTDFQRKQVKQLQKTGPKEVKQLHQTGSNLLKLLEKERVNDNQTGKRYHSRTFRGKTTEVGEKKDRRAPKECSSTTQVQYNATLSFGLNAGQFTEESGVSTMKDCISRCCLSGNSCQLAFMLKKSCFLVKCHSSLSCKSRKAKILTYNPRLAYIVRQFDPDEEDFWNKEKIINSTLAQLERSIAKESERKPSEKILITGRILYRSLGCWHDGKTQQVLTSLEGSDFRLSTESYKSRENAITKCAIVAREKNYEVFALHNGGECRAGFMVENIWSRGRSRGCNNGIGDQTSNHVYHIMKNGSVIDHGCWKAIQRQENFTTLESIDGRVRRKYKEREDALLNCAEAAIIQSFTIFALRDGGQCFAGDGSSTSFKKNGVSKLCKNGLGSSDSKNVYEIIGTSNLPLEDKRRPNIRKEKKNPKSKGHRNYYNTTPESRVFIHGFKAGDFIHQGTVENMAECIRHCTQLINCSAAFMVQQSCFSVKCYSVKSCDTAPAVHTGYNPQISFIKPFITYSKTSSLLSKNITTLHQEKPSVSRRCETSRIYENVTLFGGINAGNFTDFGTKDDMNDCLQSCCTQERCDVAFMLGNDCYGVKCFTTQSCGTKPAKFINKYRPRIAYINKNIARQNDTAESLSLCWNGKILINYTLTGGIEAGIFYSNGNTDTMSTCMKYCCEQHDCDLAFRIDQACYTVHCKDEEKCQARKARKTNFLPQIAYKKSMTLSNSVPNDLELSTSSNQCHEKSLSTLHVYKNQTLLGGFEAGNYTFLGRTKTITQCIEKCCSLNNCDVAYSIDDNCYGIKCFSNHLCHVDDRSPDTTVTEIAIIKDIKIKKGGRCIFNYILPLSLVILTVLVLIAWLTCFHLKRNKATK